MIYFQEAEAALVGKELHPPASKTPTQLHLKPAIQQLLPKNLLKSPLHQPLRFLCPLLKYGSLSVLNVGKFFPAGKGSV